MQIAKQEVAYVDHMGSDLSIVNAARVSFGKCKTEFDLDKDGKLITYLAQHNHWTPFGHTSISLRIKCPIFVSRQLGKHQVGFVWNEVSRRYVDEEPEFYFPTEWRGKPVNAKQGSNGRCDLMYEYEYQDRLYGTPSLNEWVKISMKDSLNLYTQMVKAGCAPEQARMVLPQNMMTEFIWTGSLAAYVRVCKLRLDPHTQLETQEIAQKIASIVGELYPVSFKELMNA